MLPSKTVNEGAGQAGNAEDVTDLAELVYSASLGLNHLIAVDWPTKATCQVSARLRCQDLTGRLLHGTRVN